MHKARRAVNRPYVGSILLLLIGVVLIFVHERSDLSGAGGAIVEALGSALIIAAVLSVTVDAWFKERLLRDAFQATFGYLLPSELREEVRWVYEQDMVCFRHQQTLELIATDDPGLLTVRVSMRRDLRNVSHRNRKVQPNFALDEWGHPGMPSKITALGYEFNDTRVDEFTVDTSVPHAVSACTARPFKLPPGGEFTLWAEGEEVRHQSDAYQQVLDPATRAPTITVKTPGGIRSEVFFGDGQGTSRVKRIGADTYEMPGTLLPGQVLVVRWWPNAA